ncbi:hypothetical protein Cgig2_000205 [Carnegiea gigantea]|uniref:Pentatricopeptide repeat-containing protein n=1 Tax=Carnegiea gigantea TaxID=171969 RepID=A0A9Q1KN87_9CARY|nr:hypothetical protein Cgig2_000205 [Carnegiea gigantea]
MSWRSVYRFYQFTLAQPGFIHTSVTYNKMLDVIAKSRNIDLFWELLHEMARQKVANDKTFKLALRALAGARELKKCVEYFHLMKSHGYSYSLDTLNNVVETLCKERLVDEARHVVVKLKDWIKPNGVTYKHLICGFCDVGDVIGASRVWNLMIDNGFEADMDAVNTMIERFFKDNQFDEGLKLFQTMRRKGIQADNTTLASILCGLVSKNRVWEAYLIAKNIEKPGISMYHALIRGLLKLSKAGEATEIFREMIRKGCEPTMHAYTMLLQGHLGKRGRKGNDPLVNFDSIFVGGLVKAGRVLETTKCTERTMKRSLEVHRFDYNKFLYYFSNEDGAIMFEGVAKKLREVGLFDLADIFERYGKKMTTRDRRRTREAPQELPVT